MAVVGLISIVAGAPGVRATSQSSSECAPATADLVSSVREGRSSECVYGMLRPMPPVPLVPIFTYASVGKALRHSRMICMWRMSCGIGMDRMCSSTCSRLTGPERAASSSERELWNTS